MKHAHRIKTLAGKPKVSAHKDRAGYTMPETMAALTMLLVGAFSVFVLLLVSIQSDSEAAHYSMARSAAQQQLEWARYTVYSSLPSMSTIPSTGSGSSLPPGAVISPPTITPNYNSITGLTYVSITITWPEPGRGSDHVTMDTFVASGGINQH